MNQVMPEFAGSAIGPEQSRPLIEPGEGFLRLFEFAQGSGAVELTQRPRVRVSVIADPVALGNSSGGKGPAFWSNHLATHYEKRRFHGMLRERVEHTGRDFRLRAIVEGESHH